MPPHRASADKRRAAVLIARSDRLCAAVEREKKRALIVSEWYGAASPKIVAMRHSVSESHVSRMWSKAKEKRLLPRVGARDRQYFVQVLDGIVMVPIVMHFHVEEIEHLQRIADMAGTSVMEEARAMLIDAISDREEKH